MLAQVAFASLASMLGLIWLTITSAAQTILFGIAYGFLTGAFLALIPTSIAALTKDMQFLGARMGVAFLFSGTAGLIGNPVTGKLIDGWRGFDMARVFSAGTVCVGSMILGVAGWMEPVRE